MHLTNAFYPLSHCFCDNAFYPLIEIYSKDNRMKTNQLNQVFDYKILIKFLNRIDT